MITAGVALIALGVWSLLPRTGDDAPATVAAAPAVEPEPQPQAETVATPEPEPAAEPTVSLDEQLRLAADLTRTDTALATLFSLWGLELDASGDGCAEAARSGYECLAQRGSWGSLRQYDRPAILTLTDSAGERHEVVLQAIRGDRAPRAARPD